MISDNIKSFVEDDFGRLFIATQFGLSIYDPIVASYYNINEELTDRGKIHQNAVHDLVKDGDGNIWLGPPGGRGARFMMYNVSEDTIYHFIPESRASFPTLHSPIVNSVVYDKKRNSI